MDADNLAWLMDLLDREGWPAQDPISSQNAWILCQHGGLEEVRRCRELAEPLVGHGVDPQHVALLLDTERVLSGQPQVYGTRVRLQDDVVRPCPIEEAAQVDQRRESVGWPPLDVYLEAFEGEGRRVFSEPWPQCPLEP